ncbi:MAG: hypothetical protein WCH84_09455, partial [Verrucomicrobiota bacterium]
LKSKKKSHRVWYQLWGQVTEEDVYRNTAYPGPAAFHAGVVQAVYDVFAGKAKLWFKSNRSTSVWSYRQGTMLECLRASICNRLPTSLEKCAAEDKVLPTPTPWPPTN